MNGEKTIILTQQKEYRENNKEVISEKMIIHSKKYRENNKEKVKESYNKWYQNNKEKLLETKREKILCDICGSCVSKGFLQEHKKTKKCVIN